MNYITLFSGAGIGDFELSNFGFECLASCEIDEKRLAIQKLNRKCKSEDGYICGDLSKDETKEKLKRKLKGQKLNLLLATPPCQGMSVANHKKKDEIKRNSLVVESVNLVGELKPEVFVFENVSTFLNTICFNGESNLKIGDLIKRLENDYLIYSKVLNFKNYGANSSRTRTLVIGVLKTIHVTPLDLFPKFENEKTLREVIGDLESLETMGEFSKNDVLHNFRSYDKRMFSWICGLKEGQSAFENLDIQNRPHTFKNGVLVENANKNGDKYKRQFWDKVAPCVHTRSDILASQNTIHPQDNRVFSVREIMRFMNISDKFDWGEKCLKNNEQKKEFLKKNELFVRKCIGEAVPCVIFSQIAQNYKNAMSFDIIAKKIESKVDKKQNAMYFTNQETAFNMVKDLPDFKEKECLRILEPSCGVGSLLKQVVKKYDGKKLEIDCYEILESNINEAKKYFKNSDKVKFNFICGDFLCENVSGGYDIIIGNPPFGKLKTSYKSNLKTNNIFAYFVEKVLNLGEFIYFITPKSLLNAPEFSQLRDMINAKQIIKINDYGESAFDIKIETISFLLQNKQSNSNSVTSINSANFCGSKKQFYITKNSFDSWLIYRDEFFDSVADELKFGVFNTFRDRQLTKNLLKDSGKIRVLKSRNITATGVLNVAKYDKFVDDVKNLSVGKFLNEPNLVLVPNLTYLPRAIFKPLNTVADGSVAILQPKESVTQDDLEYFSSDEFRKFYKIARNYGTRSLNIDSNSVKFFGIKRS